MTKAIQVRMTDSEGKQYSWRVWHVARAWNCGGNIPYGKGKLISGWQYEDHEGYSRFSEGSWRDLVATFNATATNYGFTCNLS